jgi:hypothetical protein
MMLPRSAIQSESLYSGRKTDTVDWPRALPAAAQSQAKARRAGPRDLMVLLLLHGPLVAQPLFNVHGGEDEGKNGW